MSLPRDREQELARVLDRVVRSCDLHSRLRNDPVELVRRARGDRERELVGLLSAALAFGNVKALRAGIECALARLGEDILGMADEPDTALRALDGFQYRMIQGSDLARLICGARAMQRRSGSLGLAFADHLRRCQGQLRPALCGWRNELRAEAGLGADLSPHRRGPAHVLPDPSGSSCCKRLLLFLRWMIRPDDGVDLGLWAVHHIPPSLLLVPVDTHVLRMGQNLGLTARADASWVTSEQITAAFRRLDPQDPVRYDFALCHLAMAQSCPGRRDPIRCAGCLATDVCQYWWGWKRQMTPGRSRAILPPRARSGE